MLEAFTARGNHPSSYFMSEQGTLTKVFPISAGACDPEEVEFLEGNIDIFVDRCNKLGIPISQVVSQRMLYLNDKFHFMQEVQYAGKDIWELAPVLTESQKETVVEQFLQMYAKVFAGGFSVGLDAKPQNFCLDAKDILRYIDFTPPRIHAYSDVHYSDWPEPPAEFREYHVKRYFSQEQIIVCYAQLLHMGVRTPMNARFIRDRIHGVFGDEIAALIDFPPDRISQVLTKPIHADVDVLRCLAGEAAAEGRLDPVLLDESYRCTHISRGAMYPDQTRLLRAAEIINASF